MMLDDRVVVVRHRAGDAVYHLLPGGGVGYRETLADALEREVVEETGLEARIGAPLLINDTIDPNGPRHVVNITFWAQITGGSLTDSPADDRVEAVELVAPEGLASLDLRPPIAQQLVSAIARGQSAKTEYLGPIFSQGRREDIT